MPYHGNAARYPVHAAAQEGRLADLAADLTAKQAPSGLVAGTPRPPPLSHRRTQLPRCPLSPAPCLCGGSAGGAG